MYEFYYNRIKGFDEGTNNQPGNLTTKYYKANQKEVDGLRTHVTEILAELEYEIKCDPSVRKVFDIPLPAQHKKRGGKRYTLGDVVEDLYTQICIDEKDPPESMINRWNVIWEQEDCPEAMIKPIMSARPKLKLNNELFDFTKGDK